MKPVIPQGHRNLRALMRRRLPAKIFKRLQEIGRLADATSMSAYLVGGLVRDLLLGRQNLDVDIAVEGDGMAFARRLADRYGAGLKVFDRFATALVVFPFGFHIEKHTLTLLKEASASDLVRRLSGPRLRNEVMRLLSEQAPARAIRRMAEFDLLRFLHADLALTSHLAGLLVDLGKSLAWWTKRFPRRPLDRALAYFMGLLDGLSASAPDSVAKRLPLPGEQANNISLAKRHLAPALRSLARHRSPKPSETYRALANLPNEGLVLLIAKARSKGIAHLVSAYVTTQQHVKPSLNGTDLKALGLKPCPIYKKILDRLLEARLNCEVKTKADERKLVKKLAEV